VSRVAVILAGGSGERFWPLSTSARPKQLLKLGGSDRTLLQEALDRAEPIFGAERVFVSTSQTIAEAIRSSHVLDDGHILAEPSAKNTLGAICWAVSQLQRLGYGDSDTVAVLTSDHAIGAGFEATVGRALDLAEETNGLVTIGIEPTRAETGYGYIHLGDGYDVRGFAEKPDLETAAEYVESGEYLWNSGMFFWTIGAFRRELAEHAPEASAVLERLAREPEAFSELPSLPIDRALMEKSRKISVVPASFDWDDVGSWDGLARTNASDSDGNVLIGDVTSLDAAGVIVYSDDIPVGIIGVEDIVVVATASGVLVCHRSEAQRVREIVALLKK
jgi:mannose-1-phosphate guanylyltransferase